MRASVIIATINGANVIKDALISLTEQSLPIDEYEIIVVDESNNDAVAEIVKEVNPRIIYCRREMLGQHLAKNLGVRLAKADIVLFTDDDVVVDKCWIEEILKGYSNPLVGAVGGRIIGLWEEPAAKWMKYFSSFGDIRNDYIITTLDLGIRFGFYGIHTLPKKLYRLYGANISMRKDIILEIGGTPPDAFPAKYNYLSGNGETDTLQSIEDLGYSLIYNHNAIVKHKIPKQRNIVPYVKQRIIDNAYRSIYTSFKRKYNGNRKRLLFDIFPNTGTFIYRCIKYILATKDERIYRGIKIYEPLAKMCQIFRVIRDKQLRELWLKKNYMETDTNDIK